MIFSTWEGGLLGALGARQRVLLNGRFHTVEHGRHGADEAAAAGARALPGETEQRERNHASLGLHRSYAGERIQSRLGDGFRSAQFEIIFNVAKHEASESF